MSELVYKIVRRPEWEAAEKSGSFRGSADDIRDGFIHLSSAAQLRATFTKHFAKRWESREDDLLLIAIDSGRLGGALKWEVSRGGEKFPHLYGALDVRLAKSVTPIIGGPDGQPGFPRGIP
jgi:uncharacterized protein (DUF952 family)